MLARRKTLQRRILCHVANSHAPLAIGTQTLGLIVNDLASEPLAIVDDIIAFHDTLASIMTSSSPLALLACCQARHDAVAPTLAVQSLDIGSCCVMSACTGPRWESALAFSHRMGNVANVGTLPQL